MSDKKVTWRNFDNGEWKKENDKFDNETFKRILNEGMDEASGKDDWPELLCASRKRAEEACGGSPPFSPNAWYNATGDILHVYLSDEASYAKWLNPHVSVMLDHETDEVVGFEICGMSFVENIKEITKWFKETNSNGENE